ncbi:MAG: NADH-quinone oxidoreductase subunit H [Chitinophagaceae bacterium]|nr:NADH-quinone oxidoreductase subunit H [Chitinophagaceae bacterium]
MKWTCGGGLLLACSRLPLGLILVIMERKFSARIQIRPGPNRVSVHFVL